MSDDNLHNQIPTGANGNVSVDSGDVLLDRLIVSVRDSAVPEGPDGQTLADTLAALRAAPASDALKPVNPSNTTKTRKILTMKNVLRLAIAACVVIAAGAVFWFAAGGNNLAFARVIEQVKQARSVRFKALIDVQMPENKKPPIETTMLISGNRLRQELPELVTVFDFTMGQVLTLDPKGKQAIRIAMKNMPAAAKSVNVIEQFREIKPEQSKDLGVKQIDGRELHGFLVDKPGQTMTVWVDPKTRVPVRIETSINMPAVPKASMVMRDFVWDDPADAREISFEIPPGYQVHSMTVDASPAAEKDLIESLRELATFNGGEFTTSFDMAGMKQALEKHYGSKRTGTKGDDDEALKLSVKIARGIMFPMTGGDDWHYAGAGVKLDAKDRSVMWYKPKGATVYHVINADLTVHEAAADALPKIESKLLLPSASPFGSATTKKSPADVK